LERPDTLEIIKLNATLKFSGDSIKRLYHEIKNGTLDLVNVQEQIDMNKTQILKTHKKMFYYKQSQSTGRWYSFLPKEGVKPPNGKKIEYATKEKLDEKIIGYYVEEENLKKEKPKGGLRNAPSFNDVSIEWRKIKNLKLKTENSINRYDSDFRRFFMYSDFGETPINQINENTINVFMLEAIRSGKLCKEATKKMFSYIKGTIRHARIEKIITENPVEFLALKDFTHLCDSKEKSTEEKQYSDDDVKQMLSFLGKQYQDNPSYIPNYAIELAVYTGMRVGELSGLKWSDVGKESIHIQRSIKHNPERNEYYIGDVKNNKPRHFPLDETTSNFFRRLKAVYLKHGGLCEWVFARDGQYINTRTLSSCNKAKWKQLHGKAKSGIHGYRHRLSSNLRTRGYSATIVASMMGHSVQTNDKHYNRNTATMEEMTSMIKEEHMILSA